MSTSSSPTVSDRKSPLGAMPNASAAAYLGISPKTLSNWRASGEGPAYIRLGQRHGRIVYRIVDLDQYLADRVVGGSR